jgi:integrase
MNRPRKRDRHLPACVYLRHGAFWLVKQGKWTRLAAADDLAGALREYARRIKTGTSGMAELIEQSIPVLVEGRAPATAKLYRLAAGKLALMLADFAPAQVERRHVVEIIEGMAATPVMAARCVSVLRLVMARAVDLQIIERNPCADLPKRPTSRRTRRVTLAEYAAIHAVASPRLRAAMSLCAITGQRIGDVLGLRRDALRPDGIRFRQAKTGAELIVAWTPELRAAADAAAALHGRVAGMFVLPGLAGRPLAHQPVWRDWKRACEAAKVEGATLHDLRALAATEARRQGLDAQALLGHATERMTLTYLRDHDVPVVTPPSIGRVQLK